jgi:copper homeostasis protein
VVLEVIATTLADGVEAQAGGADRLEVVRELDRGGLTPAMDLVEGLLARVRLPLRVMVRVEEPFVPTSPELAERMCSEARALARLPIAGVVFGALSPGHTIDLELLRRFAEAAAPCPITFHRAFELAPDPVAALAALAGVKAVDRVLTSAGEGTADARVGRLRGWRDQAPAGPALLFAAGLDPAAIRTAAEAGFEVHVGRAARAGHRIDGPVMAAMVAAVRHALIRTS